MNQILNCVVKSQFARHITRGLSLILVCLLGTWSTSSVADEQPLKVFILVGQSNMQGHADVKTLPHMAMDPKMHRMYLEMTDEASGEPRVIDDVWISYLSSNGEKHGRLTTGYGANEKKIGPELAFGMQMQKRLNQPILIIKTAWGGKSINTDFRPPSAGAYEFDPASLERMKKQNKDIAKAKQEKIAATGVYYRQMIEHIKKVLADIKRIYPDYQPQQGYEIAGIVWFQGWNDMVDNGTYPERGQDGGYDAYSEVLADFIRDIRKDLDSPELPFVIGVLGVGGPTSKYGADEKRYTKIHQNFRDAMAAPAKLPEFQENVATVLTENYWDLELASLLDREQQIKKRVKKFIKEGRQSELVKELNDNQPLTNEDREMEAKLTKNGQLEKVLIRGLTARTFTPSEFAILEVGKSNAAYHYLGSAKILSGIGAAFAEALPLAKESEK